MYDSIKNRIADFGWFNPGYYPGQFHKIDVTALPGIIVKAEYGSVAVWNMFGKGMFGDEFAAVHPIAFHAYPPGSFHTNFPVTDMASLKGRKFGIVSRVDGDILQNLGATPISVGLFAFYESLQNRVVEGIASQWTAFQPFKLQEVTKYHVDFLLGSSTALIAFNNDSWKELSDAGKKAIMSKAGEQMSRGLGKFWDGVSDEAMNEALKLPGHQLVKLSPAETEKWYKAIQPAFDEWRKTTPGSAELSKALPAEYAAVAKAATH
jgi:TRAP-type C4-dicarboxylate transport system substrate-binding protein